jgi:hypothetical protein
VLVPDFLDEKRDEIDDRLAELKPLVDEYNRLLAAAAALAGVDGESRARSVDSPALAVDGEAIRVPELSSRPGIVGSEAARDTPALERVQVEEETRTAERQQAGDNSRVAEGGQMVEPPEPVEGVKHAVASIKHGEGAKAIEHSAHAESPKPVSISSRPRDLAVAPAAVAPAPPRRAGRPKGSGTRSAEALRIVREHPGVTIPELADRMGIKQNYLYRVLPELVQEGKVAKQGRGWHPRAA